MTTFVIGFLLALMCVAIASRPAGMRDVIHRLLGVDRAPGDGDALDELRKEAPGLAAALEKPAAVDLSEVPAEVSPEAFSAAVQSEDMKEIQTQVRRLVRDRDVAEIIAILVAWNPARRRSGAASTEDYYERSLGLALKRHDFKGSVEHQRRVEWSDGNAGGRTAVPDMILRDRVLLEVKADLTQSGEVDRAMGQMLRYLLAWKGHGPAVLVVCGEVPPEIRFLVRHYIGVWRQSLRLPVTVFFKRGHARPRDVMPVMLRRRAASLIEDVVHELGWCQNFDAHVSRVVLRVAGDDHSVSGEGDFEEWSIVFVAQRSIVPWHFGPMHADSLESCDPGQRFGGIQSRCDSWALHDFLVLVDHALIEDRYDVASVDSAQHASGGSVARHEAGHDHVGIEHHAHDDRFSDCRSTGSTLTADRITLCACRADFIIDVVRSEHGQATRLGRGMNTVKCFTHPATRFREIALSMLCQFAYGLHNTRGWSRTNGSLDPGKLLQHSGFLGVQLWSC